MQKQPHRPEYTKPQRIAAWTLAGLGVAVCLPAAADPAPQPAPLQIGWQPVIERSPVAACNSPRDRARSRPRCPGVSRAQPGVALVPGWQYGGMPLPAPRPTEFNPLDSERDGSWRPSPWRYTWRGDGTSYSFGLLDTAGFMDTNARRNQRIGRFWSASLQRNPTIQFPDDTLGGGLYVPGSERRPDLYLAVTSTWGVGDQPLSRLGDLATMAAGTGMFVGAELEWQGATSYRLGAWTNTAANPRLDGTGSAPNYGLYGATFGDHASTRWELRAGLANDQVSSAAWFMSAALDQDLGGVTAGLGTAVTGASRELGPDAGESWVSELYLVRDVKDRLHFSPHLQYQHNPALAGGGEWVASIQGNLVF